MKNRIITCTLILASLAWPLQSPAEDIDLFMGPTALVTEGAPNVLFLIDNTGNWSAPFEDEMAALEGVFRAINDRVLDPDDPLAVNMGMLMFTESGAPNAGEDGAYVRAAIRSMGALDGSVTYAERYADMISGFDKIKDKANSGQAGITMAEAYLYFSGQAPYAGNQKAKADYTGNDYNTASCCGLSTPVWALTGNALDSFSGTSYNSPVVAGNCGKNFIIYVSNGAAQDPIALTVDATNLLATEGGDTSQISLSPSGSQDNMADEWSRFMKQSPEEITTFTIDVLPQTTGQGPGWSRLLKSVADESGGIAYTVTDSEDAADQIAAAVRDAIDRILGVNSVFASVALPASANAQSTFLNQVFIGQFRPDEDGHPRWPGNLKQYKLGRDTNDGNKLKVLDADGDPIVDTTDTGFIEKCAKSFWSTADTYWSGDLDLDLDDSQVCTEGGSDSTASNAPDGPVVEKGGQGQQLRAITPAARTVYTCDPTFATCGSTSTLASFVTGNGAITDTLLGVASGDRTDTINWGRGADIDDEDGDASTADMRATVHGDVIHSRPVAVNYGSDANPEIVVFYSGNDGMLRAINGNRPDNPDIVNTGSTTPGQEIWSFMPPEFYSSIDVLRRNTDIIKFPASSSDAPATGISKPYGIDGPITAFQGDVPGIGTARKYLYAGMRRAGRAIYAFDVTTPTSPQMLWKKGCPNLANDTDCTTGWTGIGQTWAQPNLLYAKGYTASGDPKPMLITGGGYDACEDADNNTTANNSCSGGTKGNIIYVLDAYDGTILKTFTTDRAVAGAVTVVPYGDGVSTGIKFAYATDTGGNIYRISGAGANAPIDTTIPSSWTITKIATLGCDTVTGGCTTTGNRKFLFGPDVIKVPNAAGQLGILVGSGDREKPLTNYGAAAAIDNYFFAVFDYPTDADWLDDPSPAVCNADIICLAALTQVSTDGVPDGVTRSLKGWRLPLAAGEQVVTGTITVANVANFSTHIPAVSSDACTSNLGTATTYNVNFKDAEGDKNDIPGGGLVPTPVAGKVILDDGEEVPFCIGCGGEDSAIGASVVGSGITWIQPKSRVYWNIQQ